jgi:hypothetical protein
MQSGAAYVVCGGESDNGEDPACSNSLSAFAYALEGVNQHTHYFGHMISAYGIAGCSDATTLSSITSSVLTLFATTIMSLFTNRL